VQLKAGVRQRGKETVKIAFQTDDVQMAVIVFVKFVEFVVGFIGHEFHELTRIKILWGVHAA